MTLEEKLVLDAVIDALHQPRDRLGRIERHHRTNESVERLRQLAVRYKLPHGGVDTIDQACMILQALLGRAPRSIRGA